MEKLVVALALVASLQVGSCATLKTCGGNLTGLYGDFQSPGFPDKYPTDTVCTWKLRVPKSHHIRITFTEFHIEEHSAECDYDKVLVKEGSNNTRLGMFCGTPATDGPKQPIETKENYAVVQLLSDYSDTAPGFWAYFTAVDTDECAVNNGKCTHFCHNYIGGYFCSCRSGYELQSDGIFCKVVCNGTKKTDLQGVIQSPEFPHVYPDRAQCDWSITLPLGYQIELNLTHMDIEEHHEVKCPYDYLTIDTGRQEEMYCGTQLPPKILSLANAMHIVFISDGSVGLSGFRATYKAKPLNCGNPGTPTHGTKVGTNYFFPNSVSYTCDQGFQLVGSVTRKCQNNGLWSGTAGVCQRVSCGDPGIPLHGTRKFISGIGRNYVFEDKLEMKCNQFYERASGSKQRTCRYDGRWSGSQLTCKPICGRRTYYNRGKIIGGSIARPHSYPWMAMLYLTPCRATHCVFCGGSILNNNYVLTAEHCFKEIRNKTFVVRVGGHQARVNKTEEWWCSVKRIVSNPNYIEATYDYDAALIEINRCVPVDTSKTATNEIVMSDHIRPICLPSSSNSQLYNVGRLGVAAGWGRRNVHNVNASSKVLREVELPIANTQSCQNHFAPQNWVITNQMFCARDVQNKKDTCQGDSGGPYMMRRTVRAEEEFVVAGIISWGDARCASGYGVYVKVTAGGIVEWIQKTING